MTPRLPCIHTRLPNVHHRSLPPSLYYDVQTTSSHDFTQLDIYNQYPRQSIQAFHASLVHSSNNNKTTHPNPPFIA